MSESLAVPLGQAQIDAAGRIREQMPQWLLSDKTLELLRTSFPDNASADQVLAKVTAINTLYATSLYAVIPMAQHIAQLNPLSTSDPVALVNQVSRMESNGRVFRSFASKFVHWFVNDRCPILDSFALRVLYTHLGKRPPNTSADDGWSAFCDDVASVRRLANLNCSEREFDRYLWLAGQCLRMEHNGRPENATKKPLAVNGDLKRLWEDCRAKRRMRDFDVLLDGFRKQEAK